MEDKGLITFRDGAPTPERGGRAKRFVTVTREGRDALASAQAAYRSLLQGLDLLTSPTRRVPHVALLFTHRVPHVRSERSDGRPWGYIPGVAHA
jgi:hypothetical protein